MKQRRRGFTLIELIVVMAIIAILVLIAAPKFMGYTEKAKLTQVINDIKVSEKAAEQYYLQHDMWPRDPLAIAYTDEQLTLWVDDFRNLSGETVTLEDGKYYEIDWNMLSEFMAKPENDFKYIIQNPVGDIYYAYELTPAGEQTKFAGDNQVTTEPQPTTEANLAPTAVITMTPETNLFTNTTITWSSLNSTDPDGYAINNVEWEGKQDVYVTAGSYTVRLRVQDELGLWSDWVEKNIVVSSINLSSKSEFVNPTTSSYSGIIQLDDLLSINSVSVDNGEINYTLIGNSINYTITNLIAKSTNYFISSYTSRTEKDYKESTGMPFFGSTLSKTVQPGGFIATGTKVGSPMFVSSRTSGGITYLKYYQAYSFNKWPVISATSYYGVNINVNYNATQ